jgi:hypothetical protein
MLGLCVNLKRKGFKLKLFVYIHSTNEVSTRICKGVGTDLK